MKEKKNNKDKKNKIQNCTLKPLTTKKKQPYFYLLPKYVPIQKNLYCRYHFFFMYSKMAAEITKDSKKKFQKIL